MLCIWTCRSQNNYISTYIVLCGKGYWSTGGSAWGQFFQTITAVRKRSQSPALKLSNLVFLLWRTLLLTSAKSVQGCEGYCSFGSTRVKLVSQTSIYGVCIQLVKKDLISLVLQLQGIALLTKQLSIFDRLILVWLARILNTVLKGMVVVNQDNTIANCVSILNSKLSPASLAVQDCV